MLTNRRICPSTPDAVFGKAACSFFIVGRNTCAILVLMISAACGQGGGASSSNRRSDEEDFRALDWEQAGVTSRTSVISCMGNRNKNRVDTHQSA
jgi:hypothetical protein